MSETPSLPLKVLHRCYKIIFGLTCLDVYKYFTFTPSSVARGHLYKLYKAQCENSKRRNFFTEPWCLFYTVTERIVNVWKSLPANVDFSSLLRYKQSVEQIDFSHFMQCDVL